MNPIHKFTYLTVVLILLLVVATFVSETGFLWSCVVSAGVIMLAYCSFKLGQFIAVNMALQAIEAVDLTPDEVLKLGLARIESRKQDALA